MSNEVSPRNASRRGFTLVELLVVIAIIAILMGILLPTLSAARKHANTVKCSSALREIGKAFQMYSWDNKGRYPVVKWDFKEGATNHAFYTLADGTVVDALYWQDLLIKYTNNRDLYARGSTGSSATAIQRFDSIRKSVFWGCPAWDGSYFTGNTTAGGDSVSFSESGYGYNIYPMWKASTTVADYTGGANYRRFIAMDSQENGLYSPNTPVGWAGWHNYRDWNPSAETCLVTEATLWLMTACPINPATGTINPQPATKAGNVAAVAFGTAGVNNIDRYRHGKLPKTNGDFFFDTGGRVGFNMLFADGHVVTLNSIKDGYKAITKRDQ